MSDFDKTNTAIAFIESGLFCAKAVQEKGAKPVIKLLINVDGVEKELALWFSKDKATGEYRVTKNGAKMLTGSLAVNDYVAPNSTQPTAQVTDFDDEIPF
jgi:hypothetical protein